MSCEDCEKAMEEGLIAFYRWKNADIGLIGCERHLKEVILALRSASRKFDGKLHCVLCGKTFEPPHGFCLTSLRGTSSLCLENNCVVVCDECFKRLYETFREMEVMP